VRHIVLLLGEVGNARRAVERPDRDDLDDAEIVDIAAAAPREVGDDPTER
jgi:hypothetical protein